MTIGHGVRRRLNEVNSCSRDRGLTGNSPANVLRPELPLKETIEDFELLLDLFPLITARQAAPALALRRRRLWERNR